MKRLLALLLCLAILLTFTACKKKKADDDTNTTTTTTEEEEVTPTYALDPVINRFFVEYIAAYGTESFNPQSIRRGAGTADTKPEDLTKEYVAVINGLNITVKNASTEVALSSGEMGMAYQLRIIIEGGTTAKSRDHLMTLFSQIARATDSSCTPAKADGAVAHLESLTESMQQDYFVSNYVRVKSYTPIIEEYRIPCKLDMTVLQYAPIEEEK